MSITVPDYDEVICPECWTEQMADELDDEFICENCGYQFGREESVD